MKAKMVAETKVEAVRALAGPGAQAIKVASEPGIPDATGRRVGKHRWRAQRRLLDFWLGWVSGGPAGRLMLGTLGRRLRGGS